MNELMKNAEQYADPTAYVAISRVMKGEKNMNIFKGDIYEVIMNNGSVREVVILAAHEDVSTVLMLSDNETLPVAVLSRRIMYTNPAMIQYVFNDKLCGYVRSMTEKETNDLINSVIECLGCVLPTNEKKTDNVDHPAHYQGKHECIDVMLAMFGVDAVKAFCKCNAYKYRFRSNAKNGQEDIEKAEWYETKLIQLEGDNT